MVVLRTSWNKIARSEAERCLDQEPAFPVHQERMVKHGIGIGEGISADELAADGVDELASLTTPQYAQGATAGNAPPAALGQPSAGRGGR